MELTVTYPFVPSMNHTIYPEFEEYFQNIWTPLLLFDIYLYLLFKNITSSWWSSR